MNKIRVIDLLVKIANGEEVPKKIKYKGIVREFDYEDKDYTCIDGKDYYLFHDTLAEGTGDKMVTGLNDEVEIIEDTPKEDKKIEYFDDYKIDVRNIDELIDSINLYIELSTNKLNEIINKINEEE